MSFTGPTLKAEIQREHIRHVRGLDEQAAKIEADLRELWTKQGVPKEKQDAIIREVEEKAKPGAWIGFQIPKDEGVNNAEK
jgi:hypothetical protein